MAFRSAPQNASKPIDTIMYNAHTAAEKVIHTSTCCRPIPDCGVAQTANLRRRFVSLNADAATEISTVTAMNAA